MVVEIKSVTKGDRTFKNIDIRDIDWDQSIEVDLRFNNPLTVESKYGISYSFAFNYNDEEVSAFVPENFKSPEYGNPLHLMISKFNQGDKLKISKHEGRMKDGRSFRYFNVIKVGEGDSPSAPQPVTEEVNLNLDVTPTYSDKEKQIIDGLKASHPEYTEEVRVKVFVQNGVAEERAKEIVKNNF